MSITPPDPETAKGFSAVDAQPDPSFLVAGMEGRFWMSVTMTTVVARRPD